jgi:hypothetical protein
MKRVIPTVLFPILLSGCADAFLNEAESQDVVSTVSFAELHDDVRTLSEASRKASRLALGYVNAAKNVSSVQDIAGAVVIVSAGATAYGVATNATSTAIADSALPGVLAGLAGRRYANKSTIAAIYNGARRLNCISAQAGMAAALGNLSRAGLEPAALVATRSTMLDAQIITRANIVRDNVEFQSVLGEFAKGFKGTETASAESDTQGRSTLLDDYVTKLSQCIDLKAPEAAPTPASANDETDAPRADAGAGDVKQG